jgi:phosphoglycerate dehydrogenase-like enzyme
VNSVPTARAPIVTVPDDRWLGLWPAGEEPVDLHAWEMTGPTDLEPALVVLPYLGTAAALPRLAGLPSLRVVQTLSAGYENVLPHVPAGVTLATAAGVHDASTAELAVGLAIGALRGFPDFVRAAERGAWAGGTRPALADRRVLLVGTGGIGSAVAARLAPFEVEVTRVGTRSRDDEHGHVHAADELPDLLPRHEVVVLATPLTEETRGMVDAAFLAAMPDGALLVNVSRGPVVVTADLVTELQAGRLLAALDVTDPEPLPPEHPLWRAPNVLVSPHVGGDSTAFPPRARALLKDQLERFATGRPLRNVVNPS